MEIPALPTATVADALVRHGLPLRLGPPTLGRWVPGPPIAGFAPPVRHAGSVGVFIEALG